MEINEIVDSGLYSTAWNELHIAIENLYYAKETTDEKALNYILKAEEFITKAKTKLNER